MINSLMPQISDHLRLVLVRMLESDEAVMEHTVRSDMVQTIVSEVDTGTRSRRRAIEDLETQFLVRIAKANKQSLIIIRTHQ